MGTRVGLAFGAQSPNFLLGEASDPGQEGTSSIHSRMFLSRGLEVQPWEDLEW